MTGSLWNKETKWYQNNIITEIISKNSEEKRTAKNKLLT